MNDGSSPVISGLDNLRFTNKATISIASTISCVSALSKHLSTLYSNGNGMSTRCKNLTMCGGNTSGDKLMAGTSDVSICVQPAQKAGSRAAG